VIVPLHRPCHRVGRMSRETAADIGYLVARSEPMVPAGSDGSPHPFNK
jgi:hypothetical protein